MVLALPFHPPYSHYPPLRAHQAIWYNDLVELYKICCECHDIPFLLNVSKFNPPKVHRSVSVDIHDTQVSGMSKDIPPYKEYKQLSLDL